MTLLSKFYAVDTPYTRPMETQAVLRAVADRIENEPETYNQNMWGAYMYEVDGDVVWVQNAHSFGDTKEDALHAESERLPDGISEISQVPEGACNTAFCIAGHALLEKGYHYGWNIHAWERSKVAVGNGYSRWVAAGGFNFLDKGGAKVDDPGREAAQFILLEDDIDCDNLFREDWKPREGIPVPDALRLIADGASVESVTSELFCFEDC